MSEEGSVIAGPSAPEDVDPVGGRRLLATGSAPSPAGLTVVYDDNCPLCRRCRRWVMGQRQLVPFRFVAASEPWVMRWLGSLVPVGDDLVVVDASGAVWVGSDAFIVCLWGLERHRGLAVGLQRRGANVVAKRAFHAVSAGRGVVSSFLTEEDPRSDGRGGRDIDCHCDAQSGQ